MVKRLIIALLALLFVSYAAPAAATTCGGFTVPTDIAAQAGWTCSTKTPTYDQTNSAHNVTIDPAVTPPPQTGLTNIPAPSYTGRVTGSVIAETTGTGAGCTNYGKVVAAGGDTGCTQAKFRTHADFTHFAPDDPIRNFASPGSSHLHCFFANASTNAYSTYKSLRKRGLLSTAIGTDVNATGYWYPCIIVKNRGGLGVDYVVKPDYFVIYYEATANTAATLAEAKRQTPLVPGLRYVFGYNMDDGNAWLQTILTAANTANQAAGGAANRYTLGNGGENWRTEAHYSCLGATVDPTMQKGSTADSRYLKKPDGTDPWNGTCTSGMQFFADIGGPDCWDGERLWTAGGYKHLIPKIFDNKYSEWVCPNNFYAVPSLVIEFQFTQYGWADYGRWELASDSAKRTALGGSTSTYPDGFSFHTDWMHGWDQVQMLKWQENCLGANNNTPHQCAVSQISGTERLVGTAGSGSAEAGAGGRNPQVDLSSVPHSLTTDPGWGKIPPAWTNSITSMHVHH